MHSSNFVRWLPWAASVFFVCSMGCTGLAVAQDVSPTVPHTMEQKLAACTSCHGPHGVGSPTHPGIPRLAGKPAAYLVQQLHYFQTGQRRHAPMEYVVRQLSPAYLVKIADYFAVQTVPVHAYPIPPVSDAQRRRGRELVLHGDKALGVPSCQSCHGTRLTGVEPMIPGIVGVSYAYLHTQLTLWREQKRAGGGTFCMGVVANRLRKSDIRAVSAWLAAQKPPADMQPVAADAHAQPLPGWCVVGKTAGVAP